MSLHLIDQIPYSEIPGISRLYLDYQAQSEQLAEFFYTYPQVKNSYLNLFAQLKERKYPRQELVEILLSQELGASDQTLANIQLLEKPATMAVVTGQQVGLFGGPLYTIYKTITAIKLARMLQEQISAPVIPIFWMAADDSDFSEINQVAFLDKSNQVAHIEYRPTENIEKKSANMIELEPELDEIILQFESNLYDTVFKPDIFALLRDCYHPKKNFPAAFGCWLTKLFGKYGLVVIDPTQVEVRRLAAPIFRKTVEEQAKCSELIQSASDMLIEKGYHQQVFLPEDKINLYIDYGGYRQPIRIGGNRYLFSGTYMRYTQEELVELIDQNPEQFSPNVLLRPIMEDFIIPTLAYVPGPNELAYYAQLKETYHLFEVQMPILFPRASITLVENKIDEVLTKYQIPILSVIKSAEKAVSDALKKSVPEEIESELQQVKKRIGTEFQQLAEKVTPWDATLGEALTTTRNTMFNQLDKLDKKIVAAHKKKNETVREQLVKITNHMVPEGNLQERVFNIVPYLVKYNFEFIDELYSAVDLNSSNHQVMRISS